MKNNFCSPQGELLDSVVDLVALQRNLTSALSSKSHVFQPAELDTAVLRRQNDYLRSRLLRITMLIEGLSLERISKNFTPLRE